MRTMCSSPLGWMILQMKDESILPVFNSLQLMGLRFLVLEADCALIEPFGELHFRGKFTVIGSDRNRGGQPSSG
jgi:hypothetical protein